MSKAILVMEKMPKGCYECDLICDDSEKPSCYYSGEYIDDKSYMHGRADCPLIPAIGYIEAKGNMVSWEESEND